MNYTHYGTDPKMDKLVDSNEYTNRIKAAEQGYGFDKLVKDKDYDVIKAVITNCNHDVDVLSDLAISPDYHIRKMVAENCGGNPEILNELISDIDNGKVNVGGRTRPMMITPARENTISLLYRINGYNIDEEENFANSIRMCVAVAEKCGGNKGILSKLSSHKHPNVKKAVNKEKEKHGIDYEK